MKPPTLNEAIDTVKQSETIDHKELRLFAEWCERHGHADLEAAAAADVGDDYLKSRGSNNASQCVLAAIRRYYRLHKPNALKITANTRLKAGRFGPRFNLDVEP